MSLKNIQYQAIMRSYEQRQDENRFLAAMRQQEIEEVIPEYAAVEASVATCSVSIAKQILFGNEQTLTHLRKKLRDLTAQKKALLTAHGYPTDYLEPIYTCRDCQDTGYVLNAQGARSKCHCFRNQEIDLLYEQSNIRALLTNENFSMLSDQYYQGEDLVRFHKAVRLCKHFVENFKEDYHNLFFYGTVGTGKSFLSGCIAHELLNEGNAVLYFSALRLFDLMAQYSFELKSTQTFYQFYDDLYNCELLIIDDLGTELTNSFVNSQLFTCLNERHIRKHSTIISTNLSLEELHTRYSDRIFSRIVNQYEFCKLSGPDIRMLKKRHITQTIP